MINSKKLKARLGSKVYHSPFMRTLAMESTPEGFKFVVLDLDVRQLSHIIESNKGYTRLCFKNGEIFYLKDNGDLHKIKYLRQHISEEQHVEEFLIMKN